MRTLILAGGLGTRLQEETTTKPKPMVEIGEHPVLWHIMQSYAAYGHREFVVALGYRGDVIKRYFLDYARVRGDFSLSLRNGAYRSHGRATEDWDVYCLDTGPQTATGGRVWRARHLFLDGRFFLTYGDGLANVNLRALLDFHIRHGKLATLTAVHPPARFGALTLDGAQVVSFEEKAQEGWVNGGFFVLEPDVLEYLRTDDIDTVAFEHTPLERLARDGQLMAYRHTGFWQCMDTLRDVRLLQDLWASKQAPWKVWR